MPLSVRVTLTRGIRFGARPTANHSSCICSPSSGVVSDSGGGRHHCHTPETLLVWYRKLIAQKYDGSGKRGPGRPRSDEEIEALMVRMAKEIGMGPASRACRKKSC